MIGPITLPLEAFAPLRAEAREEGFNFVERTAVEWESGANRFDGPGEMLCGCFEGEELIAIGGLTADPFAGKAEVGRIRRVYVRAAWRSQGVGGSMVKFLVGEAARTFCEVRLRAENGNAGRLYERLGFVALENDADATHALMVRP